MIKHLEHPHTRAIILNSYITEKMNLGEGGDKTFGASTHKGNNLELLHYRTDELGGRG